MHDDRTGSARFEIVTNVDLPPGRYCTITEVDGHVAVKLLAGEAATTNGTQRESWCI